MFDIGISSLDADDDGPRLQIIDDGPIRLNSGGRGDDSIGDFGASMLMNDRKKGAITPTDDIDLGDLDTLENELNSLGGSKSGSLSKRTAFMSDLPRFGGGSDMPSSSIKFSNDNSMSASGVPSIDGADAIKIQIAKDINASQSAEGTWDGFKTFNEIPIASDSAIESTPKMTREDMLRRKFELIRKLEHLESKGVKLSKHYTMESSLTEMEGEYEMIVSEREKLNSIKFQGKMLLTLVNGIEFLNGKFDPFDFKLDGWTESVSENLDDYNEIFEELHEKYKSKAKFAPELKLLFQLGGSAIMLHMTNSLFKSAMPGMDDIMRQNPELAHQFQEAAVRSMSQQNPGFGNFVGSVMSGGGANTRSMGSGGGGSGAGSVGGGGGGGSGGSNNYDYSRGGNNFSGSSGAAGSSMDFSAPPNRPDIGMSRGIPNFSDGENMEDRFGRTNDSGGMQPPPGSSGSRTATLSQVQGQPQKSKPASRPEMKGPSNLDDLLAGLKPKTSAGAGSGLMPSTKTAPIQRTQPAAMSQQQQRMPFQSSEPRSMTPRTMTPRAMTPRQPTPPPMTSTESDSLPQVRPIQQSPFIGRSEITKLGMDDDRISITSMNDDKISFVSGLDEVSSKVSGTNKRGRRKSDKNRVTVSLDI